MQHADGVVVCHHGLELDALRAQRALCAARSEDGAARDVQDADGIFVRHLPAPLLADVNIVDTPGTNVILDRQQRLTEEFVPRADLVLFTMSAGGSVCSQTRA